MPVTVPMNSVPAAHHQPAAPSLTGVHFLFCSFMTSLCMRCVNASWQIWQSWSELRWRVLLTFQCPCQSKSTPARDGASCSHTQPEQFFPVINLIYLIKISKIIFLHSMFVDQKNQFFVTIVVNFYSSNTDGCLPTLDHKCFFFF